MTEPDEALLYAREQMADDLQQNGCSAEDVAAARAGAFDTLLKVAAAFYRAGAVASAARIKELEARVAELEAALRPSMWVGPTGIDISFSAPGRPLSSNPVDDSGRADTEVKDPDQ